MGISDATFYNWRKKFGSMGISEIRRLKARSEVKGAESNEIREKEQGLWEQGTEEKAEGVVKKSRRKGTQGTEPGKEVRSEQ